MGLGSSTHLGHAFFQFYVEQLLLAEVDPRLKLHISIFFFGHEFPRKVVFFKSKQLPL